MNVTSALPDSMFGPSDDVNTSRGWRAATQLTYDLGPFKLGASVAVNHVDSRFERGTYAFVGVSLYRTFRLSRWNIGWIALTLGRQQWFGAMPPNGEANATTASLNIGMTFR